MDDFSKKYSNRLAIVGMAGRFPGVDDIDAFWDALVNGKELIKFFEREELLQAGHTLDEISQKRYVAAKSILKDIEWFDADFFQIPPQEAALLDPQHRVMLETAWEALEDAGCNPEQYEGYIGAYLSQSLSTYFFNNVLQNKEKTQYLNKHQLLFSFDKDYLPTRLSYKLGLTGPSMAIQSACSSSLLSVHVACQELLSYHCDVALAGGVSITVPQTAGYLYQEGMILSQDGHCKPFDKNATGTVDGNGAGIIVIKRLLDAIDDGDNILAVIRGTGVTNDGKDKIGFTAPSIDGQEQAIANAYAFSDVSPNSVSYVECHGTGTNLGDPVEIQALANVFGHSDSGHIDSDPCYIGSVKANIGHLDAASGIVSLIKVLLSIQHQKIPPLVHFQQFNEAIAGIQSGFKVNTQAVDWSPNGKRRAAISSFGMGGTNVHMIIEEPPALPARPQSKTRYPILLSSNSRQQLNEQATKIKSFLSTNRQGISLGDFAYTLAIKRKHFPVRHSFLVANFEELQEKLVLVSQRKADIDVMDRFTAIGFGGELQEDITLSCVEKDFPTEHQQLVTLFEKLKTQNQSADNTVNEQDLRGVSLDDNEIRYAVYVIFILGLLDKSTIKIDACLTQGLSTTIVSHYRRGSVDQAVDALRQQKLKMKNSGIVKADAIVCANGSIKTIHNQAILGGVDPDTQGENYHIYELCGDRLAFTQYSNARVDEANGLSAIIQLFGQRWQNDRFSQWEIFFEEKHYRTVSLPTYSFDRKRHWINACDTTSDMVGEHSHSTINYSIATEVESLYQLSLKDYLNDKLPLLDSYCKQFIVKFFVKHCPQIQHEALAVDTVIDAIGILPKYKRLVAYMLASIAPVIDKDTFGRCQINRDTVRSLWATNDRVDPEGSSFTAINNLLIRCFDNYHEVLIGHKSPLEVLFPNGRSDYLMETYAQIANVNYERAYINAIQHIIEDVADKHGGKISILEIGAGQGKILGSLPSDLNKKIKRYTFTDISPSFVGAAKQRFAEKFKEMEFKVFDITKNPQEQGIEHTYHLILGLNVLHATPDLQQSFSQLDKLLAINGQTVLLELIVHYLWDNLVWGMTDGWWLFQDTYRQELPIIERNKWSSFCKQLDNYDCTLYPIDEIESNDHVLMNCVKLASAQALLTHSDTNAPVVMDKVTLNGDPVLGKSQDFDTYTTAIKSIWEDILGVSNININDNFFDLGGESIAALQTNTEIEKRLGIQLSPNLIIANPTLRELVSHLECATSSRQTKDTKRYANILQQGRHDVAPLFIVPGAGGHGFFYHYMLKYFHDDKPVISFDAKGLTTNEAPHTSIDAMSDAYTAELLDMIPTKHLHLMGNSMGGTVVFDMAQKLHQQGIDIKSVILIDTPGPSYFPKPFTDTNEKILQLFGEILKVKLDAEKIAALPTVDEKLHYVVHAEQSSKQILDTDGARQIMDVFDAHFQAMLDYKPNDFAGKIYYLYAKERRHNDPTNSYIPWISIANGGIEIHRIDGNHISMFHPENIGNIGRLINSLTTIDS